MLHSNDLRALAAALLALPLAACPGSPAPVAEVTAEPSEVTLPYPGFSDLELEIEPALELPAGEGDPLVFVHLLSEPGEVLRTFDHPLPDGWRPGEPLSDPIRLYQSALASPLPPGVYQLSIGLYRPPGERWPLSTPGEEIGQREYAVAQVEVPPRADDGPRFEFSPAWQTVETGTDRQVLARRWLAGPGTIRLTGVSGPGTVWMSLWLPPATTPGARFVLAEGAAEAAVLVSADCGGSEVTICGAGPHRLELPLSGEGGEEGCTLRVEPNFHLVLEDSFERRSLSLDVLSWMPGAS